MGLTTILKEIITVLDWLADTTAADHTGTGNYGAMSNLLTDIRNDLQAGKAEPRVQKKR